jgi:hypothetical protein
MVSVPASSAVDRGGFEHLLDQTKDFTTDICFFSILYAALRGKSKNPQTVVSVS